MAAGAQERISEVAERLFARRGLGAVSLREVSAASGQRNTSAVQYHFGSKQGLIEAILRRRIEPVNERRLARLADLERAGQAQDLRALVEAMVYPLTESLKPGSCYVRFVAQTLADPVQSQIMSFRLGVQDAMDQINTRIVAQSRGLPASLCVQRLFFAARLWVQALAEHERELENGQPSMPTAALAAELVDLVVGMISAPVSPPVERSVRRWTRAAAPTRKGRARRRRTAA